MVKSNKKQLKVIDISEETNNTNREEIINTEAQELDEIKQEMEEEKSDELIEAPIEEKPDKKKINNEYMKNYRIKKQAENKKIKEDLNNIKNKIVEKVIEEKPLEIKAPKNIKKTIIKSPKPIKEVPNYDSIPEEIIQKEIYKRQENLKQQRIINKQEKLQKLIMNIA